MAIEKTVKNVNLLKNSAKTCHNKIEKKNCVQKIGKLTKNKISLLS